MTAPAADVTGAKLRLLIVGWMIGKGSTGLYAKELADYLSRAGHDVTCLSAGVCDWRLKPHLVTRQRHPFTIIELRNPPIVPCTRSAEPTSDIDSPETVRLLREVLATLQPDIVAILDLPGWPARAIEACQDAGSKVMVFLQNFWPFCTRLSLFDRWGKVCGDYQEGNRCVDCMATVVGSEAARWRARLPSVLWKYAGLHASLKSLYRAGASARGSVAVPRGPSYAARRHAYAEAIGRADLLCGISGRTIELAASFGVSCATTRIVPIVLSHMQPLQQACAARGHKASVPRRPIRFGYLGAHSPEKGPEILVAAFDGVAREDAELHFHGGGGADYVRRLTAMAAPSNPPIFHGPWRQDDFPSILGAIDVGIVPSTCEDTRPSTVLEFQAAGIPVIGSRIGGIPEQVDDGRNGLLFEPGNPAALRAAIDRVIREPDLIAAWRANLPTDFDPELSWRQLERIFLEMAAAR